ncbi:MAG: hypothetical protein GXP61_08180 [Epsilonproteobacteria bacterium]|nr:hypothetical protein [Campylobacterota bacterium]
MKKEIRLGDKVEDTVTGLRGIVTARVEYLNGCVQFCVIPKIKDKSGKSSEYIDVQQLRKLKGGLQIKARAVGGHKANTPNPSYKI